MAQYRLLFSQLSPRAKPSVGEQPAAAPVGDLRCRTSRDAPTSPRNQYWSLPYRIVISILAAVTFWLMALTGLDGSDGLIKYTGTPPWYVHLLTLSAGTFVGITTNDALKAFRYPQKLSWLSHIFAAFAITYASTAYTAIFLALTLMDAPSELAHGMGMMLFLYRAYYLRFWNLASCDSFTELWQKKGDLSASEYLRIFISFLAGIGYSLFVSDSAFFAFSYPMTAWFGVAADNNALLIAAYIWASLGAITSVLPVSLWILYGLRSLTFSEHNDIHTPTDRYHFFGFLLSALVIFSIVGGIISSDGEAFSKLIGADAASISRLIFSIFFAMIASAPGLGSLCRNLCAPRRSTLALARVDDADDRLVVIPSSPPPSALTVAIMQPLPHTGCLTPRS